ncbi:MAG: amidohydrolase family protein [Pseudomonadota bacterium]
MPDFPIVDSHVHFWDAQKVPLSWPTGNATLDRTFLPSDYPASPQQVDTIVFLEADVDPGAHVKEAEWVAALSNEDARIKAISAHAPLEKGLAVEADLKRLAELPTVRAIRRLIQSQDADKLCASDEFRDGVRLCARYDLPFEICILHHQFSAVLDMVAALPEVHFVLDHIGKPGIKDGLREPWWDQIGRLSEFAHVDVKISGAATEADHANWREEEVLPYVERALEVFGADRAMFGSDWPVQSLASDFARWVDLLDHAVAGWSPADKRRLYRDTATRVYRL